MSHWMTSGSSRLKVRQNRTFSARAQQRANFLNSSAGNVHSSRAPTRRKAQTRQKQPFKVGDNVSVKVISPRRRFPRGVIAVSASLVPPGRECVENELTAEPLQSVQDQRYSRSNKVSSSMGARQHREPYGNPHRRIRRVATRMNPFPRAGAPFNPTSSTMEGTIGGHRMAGARFKTITEDLSPSGISPREDRSIAEALKKRRYRTLPQTGLPGRSLDPDEFDDIFMREQPYQSPQAAMLLSPGASPSGAKSQTESAFDPSQTNTKRSPNASQLPLPDSEGLKRDSPFRNELRLQEDIGEQPLRLGGSPSTNKKSGGLRLPARRTVVANDQEPPVRFVETRGSFSMPTGVKRNQWSLGSVSTLSKKTQSSCDVRPIVTTSANHPSYLGEPKIGKAVTRCLPSSNDASSKPSVVHHNPIRFFNNGEEVNVDGCLVQSTNNTVAVKQEQPPTPAKDCMRSRPLINQNPEDRPATNLQDCIRRPSASLSNKYDYPNELTEYQASIWEMVTKEEEYPRMQNTGTYQEPRWRNHDAKPSNELSPNHIGTRTKHSTQEPCQANHRQSYQQMI